MKKLFFSVCFLFLAFGCATQYTVPVVDVKIDAKKIPMRVGIVIPDENFTLTKSMPDFAGATTTLTVPFGQLIKKSSSDILPYAFESIEIVKGEPYPPGIRALFATTVDDFYKEPEHGGKPSVVHVKLTSRMTDLEGIPIWSKTLSVREEEWMPTLGLWSYEANSRFWAGIIAKAVANALQQSAKEISLSREVHLFASAKRGTAAPTFASGHSPLTTKSDIDGLTSKTAKPNRKAYAVVIGIEQYRQKLPNADFAVNDAKLMSEYLIKVLGYPEENVILLLNDHASHVDMVKYLEKWLPNNVEVGASVFVYYSGHGSPDPRTNGAYLVPFDGDPTFIAETGYSLKRMYNALGKLPAQKIIVALDSCFSGSGGRSVLAAGARPLVMNLPQSSDIPENLTVLAAAAGNQVSSTYREKGHGLFTYYLLKGFKNEDVIKQDGSIEIDELFKYLKPQVERIARKQYNNEQTPQLIESK